VVWDPWRLIFRLYFREFEEHPERLARMDPGEPEVDRRIFESPGVREILVETFREAFRQGTLGTAREGWLLARPWGFALEEDEVRSFLWQGEEDVIVTPAMGRFMAARLPNCVARFLPGEGHLLLFTRWREILEDLATSR